jgi:thioredoxin-like negative regulator of GroEL
MPHFQKSPFVKDLANDEEALSMMKAGPQPKIVLVHAPWCGHCRNMMGAFIQAASTNTNVLWTRADGNTVPSLVRREDLRGFPTIYGVKVDGTITQHNGARDVSSLLAFAKDLLPPTFESDVPAKVVDEKAPTSFPPTPKIEEVSEEEEETEL